MPIDRANLRNLYEGQVKNQLKARTSTIGKALLDAQNAASSGREAFLGLGSNYAAGMGINPISAPNTTYSNRLNEALNLTRLGQMRGVGMGTADMTYQNLLRGADFATNQRTSAEGYSRAAGEAEQNRAFQASMADKQRQGVLDREAMAGGYADRGVALENSYQDQMLNNMYQQALYRSLFGLGGTAAGIGVVGMMNKQPSTYMPDYSNFNQQNPGMTLRQSTGTSTNPSLYGYRNPFGGYQYGR